VTKVRLQPHKELDPSVWAPGPWLVRHSAGDEAVEVGQMVRDFDYATTLSFGFSVTVDVASALATLGLESSSTIGVYAAIDCEASSLRTTSVVPVDEATSEVWVEAMPGTIAGAVALQRGLVTIAALGSRSALSPHRFGTRLLDGASVTVTLEGGASRFPVEALSFRAAGLPARAAWLLDVVYEEPSDRFLGAVRLRVNTDHPAGVAALSRDRTSEAELARSALRVDVVRQMFAHLSRDERFAEKQRWADDDCIGGVAEAIASVMSESVSTVCAMLRDDPVGLDALVQSAFGYLAPTEA